MITSLSNAFTIVIVLAVSFSSFALVSPSNGDTGLARGMKCQSDDYSFQITNSTFVNGDGTSFGVTKESWDGHIHGTADFLQSIHVEYDSDYGCFRRVSVVVMGTTYNYHRCDGGGTPDQLCRNAGVASSSHFKLTRHWKVEALAAPSDYVKVVFAVKQKNSHLLNSMLETVSDPRSPFYGHYLSLDEVTTLTRDDVALAAVTSFVNQMKPKQVFVSKGGDYVTAIVKVEHASIHLHANFFKLRHASSDRSIVRAPEVTLPDSVKPFVDFVGHVTDIPSSSGVKIRSFGTSKSSIGATSGTVTPQLLMSYYNITNPSVRADSLSTQGVFESESQFINPDDISDFQKTYKVFEKPISTIIGPNDPNACKLKGEESCGESTLDVQYMMSIAQGANTTFWSIPSDDLTPFIDWIIAVGNIDKPPLVHSVSYGDDMKAEQVKRYQRFEDDMSKVSLRGITVMVSSGDDGVTTPDSRNNTAACGFFASYPATSKYVTSVGATQGPEDGKSESACLSNTGGVVTSGGGFSILNDRPSYQSATVEAYLASSVTLPPSSMYVKGGRGYPDVSVLGHNYEILINGKMMTVSGTSASSPVFAAFITLVNDERFARGKPAVGFLNPALYLLAENKDAATSSFRGMAVDIANNKNNCNAGHPGSISCCPYGFEVTSSGWNPVTGLGGVMFPQLFKALVEN